MSAVELEPPPVRAYRPAVLSTRLLRSELGMVFGRRRNQAILAVLAAIPVLIAVAIRVTAPQGDGDGEGGGCGGRQRGVARRDRGDAHGRHQGSRRLRPDREAPRGAEQGVEQQRPDGRPQPLDR